MKRFLPILSIILLTAIHSRGQVRLASSHADAAPRIMKFYPNPAVSSIKFDFQKNYDKGYSLQVISFLGKQVQEVKNINPSTTIDLSAYTRGVYIYQLRDQGGKVVESGKFQVSK